MPLLFPFNLLKSFLCCTNNNSNKRKRFNDDLQTDEINNNVNKRIAIRNKDRIIPVIKQTNYSPDYNSTSNYNYPNNNTDNYNTSTYKPENNKDIPNRVYSNTLNELIGDKSLSNVKDYYTTLNNNNTSNGNYYTTLNTNSNPVSYLNNNVTNKTQNKSIKKRKENYEELINDNNKELAMKYINIVSECYNKKCRVKTDIEKQLRVYKIPIQNFCFIVDALNLMIDTYNDTTYEEKMRDAQYILFYLELLL